MEVVSGLILGWMLAQFGFMPIMQVGCQELFGLTISSEAYYFIFALCGGVAYVLRELKAIRG